MRSWKKIKENMGQKRCVFRWCLKVLSVSDAVRLDGKVFQMRSAAKNSRSPIVVRHKDGVIRADVDVGRSLFLESTSATQRSLLTRYGRAVPCKHRKTSTKSLNCIHSGTRSHWRSQSSRVMCSYFRADCRANMSCSGIHQTVVCRAGCQVDRRASHCHSPGATDPARRPATVVLLVTSTDKCCATGVVRRISWTQSWHGHVGLHGHVWVDVDSWLADWCC